MSLGPFNKTFKMSSPSDSSSCTSESDLESFTVDEVMGELSDFEPYDDSCEPLATEEEAADYNERVHQQLLRLLYALKGFNPLILIGD